MRRACVRRTFDRVGAPVKPLLAMSHTVDVAPGVVTYDMVATPVQRTGQGPLSARSAVTLVVRSRPPKHVKQLSWYRHGSLGPARGRFKVIKSPAAANETTKRASSARYEYET